MLSTCLQKFVLNIIFELIYIMGDSQPFETPQPIEQQVTSKDPTKRIKDPKKVAAGKALQKKNREAREAQKKALDEANAIIANLEKKTPDATTPAEAEAAPAEADPGAILTTTQWLSGISIFLSIVGIYYKREEIKALFTEKTPPVEPKKEGRIRNMDLKFLN